MQYILGQPPPNLEIMHLISISLPKHTLFITMESHSSFGVVSRMPSLYTQFTDLPLGGSCYMDSTRSFYIKFPVNYQLTPTNYHNWKVLVESLEQWLNKHITQLIQFPIHSTNIYRVSNICIHVLGTGGYSSEQRRHGSCPHRAFIYYFISLCLGKKTLFFNMEKHEFY